MWKAEGTSKGTNKGTANPGPDARGLGNQGTGKHGDQHEAQDLSEALVASPWGWATAPWASNLAMGTTRPAGAD